MELFMDPISSKLGSSVHDSGIDAITLDCDHILTHTGGDPDLLIHLCRMFLGDLPLRMDSLRAAVLERDYQHAGRALQQLHNCLAVFGSGPAAFTAELLSDAVRNRRCRQIQREWKNLARQLEEMVPQVQRLILEVAVPRTAIQ